MNNVKKNYIYNVIYQILILIIPLITAPYLARTIGATGIGIYSYRYSIVYYFMLFTMLGVNNYGSKTIAKIRDDKNNLSKTFFEIYAMQLIVGCIVLVIYCCMLIGVKQYTEIAKIDILFIVSAILDINWFFFGIEEFKKTITRNAIIKISCVILIFVFVKQSTDVWKYTLIMASTTCFSQIVLWLFLRKKITFHKINFLDIKKHIKQNLILFIPYIAVSLYKIMDKIMLGSIVSVTEVGYYENAEKIINIPQSFIVALGTVMLPRLSNTIAKGNSDDAKKYMLTSIKFAMFLSAASCLGLVCIGCNFSIIYFGSEFVKTGTLIMLLSIILPFLAFANIIRTQFLIPNEKNRIFIISVLIGASVNLIINILLIPRFSSVGAAIGTILAEVSVMLYQVFNVKNDLPLIDYFKISIEFLIKAAMMAIIIYPINYISISKYYIFIIQVLSGITVYCVLNKDYLYGLIKSKERVCHERMH